MGIRLKRGYVFVYFVCFGEVHMCGRCLHICLVLVLNR